PERLVGADERVLDDIPRLSRIPREVVGETVDELAILLDERLEGRQVAGAAPLDQGRFVAVHVDSPARSPRRRLDDGAATPIHLRGIGRRETEASASKPSR